MSPNLRLSFKKRVHRRTLLKGLWTTKVQRYLASPLPSIASILSPFATWWFQFYDSDMIMCFIMNLKRLSIYAAAKALCCGKKNISIPLLFSFILFCFVRLQKFQIYFVKPTSQCNIILGFNHSESSGYVSGMVAWSLDNLIVGILIDQ